MIQINSHSMSLSSTSKTMLSISERKMFVPDKMEHSMASSHSRTRSVPLMMVAGASASKMSSMGKARIIVKILKMNTQTWLS